MAIKKKTPEKKKKEVKGKVTRFKKGISGNKAGRPVGIKSLSVVLQDLVNADEIKLEITTMRPGDNPGDNPIPEKNSFHIKSNMTIKYAVNVALINKALRGDVNAISLIYDRLEGRAIQTNLVADGDKYKHLSTDEKRVKLLELFGSNPTKVA